MIEKILERTRTEATHRVWLISDIQMADEAFVTRCIETALADFRRLALPCDVIWYLGDAGANNTKATAAIQLRLFGALGLPLRFINGGHDFDLTMRYYDECGIVLPFYEHVKRQPGWKTAASCADLCFTDSLGPFAVWFFPAHAAEDFSWCSRGNLTRGKDVYPHTQEVFDKLRAEIGASPKPVILCTHEPFPPAPRHNEVTLRLLPLPGNVMASFHGHCHIGERSQINLAPYAKVTWVGNQDIPQFNISALEDKRADAIRSAFLEIYPDGSLGVFFRNHSEGRWTESVTVTPKRRMPNPPG